MRTFGYTDPTAPMLDALDRVRRARGRIVGHERDRPVPARMRLRLLQAGLIETAPDPEPVLRDPHRLTERGRLALQVWRIGLAQGRLETRRKAWQRAAAARKKGGNESR